MSKINGRTIHKVSIQTRLSLLHDCIPNQHQATSFCCLYSEAKLLIKLSYQNPNGCFKILHQYGLLLNQKQNLQRSLMSYPFPILTCLVFLACIYNPYIYVYIYNPKYDENILLKGTEVIPLNSHGNKYSSLIYMILLLSELDEKQNSFT